MVIKQQIVNFFRKNLLASASIREISLSLKKSYSKVHQAIKELEKEGMIKIEQKGQAKFCSFSFTDEAINYASFLEEQEALKRKVPNIIKILNLKELSDDIIIVAGSYADYSEKRQSDVDLVVLTSDKNIVKKQKLIENESITFKPEFHIYVFNYKDFSEMLFDDKDNYGKEVFKKHLILKNSRKFYELTKEAIRHGYKG